jgi:hypothetical protein
MIKGALRWPIWLRRTLNLRAPPHALTPGLPALSLAV